MLDMQMVEVNSSMILWNLSQILSFNLQFLIGAKKKQLNRFIKEDICNSFKLSSKLSNDVLISSVAIIRIFYH